jgi:hypothetical protein
MGPLSNPGVGCWVTRVTAAQTSSVARPDAEHLRKLLSRLHLRDAGEIGSKRYRVAALVAGCKVRPCASADVDEERTWLAIGAAGVAHNIFAAIKPPAR